MMTEITDDEIYAAALRAAKRLPRASSVETIAGAVLRAARPLIEEQRTQVLKSWNPRRLREMRHTPQSLVRIGR